MTEEEARAWVLERCGERTRSVLQRYCDLIVQHNTEQNLVAASTLPNLWSRHIVDSLQLADLVSGIGGSWHDIGSGAGLPGLVIAIATTWDVRLVEPRKLRVGFMNLCIEALRISAAVEPCKVQNFHGPVGRIISARAVSSLDRIFEATCHIADEKTQWILPKGRTAELEIAEARARWHGSFHVEQSVVDPTSLIVVASGVRRR